MMSERETTVSIDDATMPVTQGADGGTPIKVRSYAVEIALRLDGGDPARDVEAQG